MLLEPLSFAGEEHETLIQVNHPSVAFQASSDCCAPYLSKICISNVSFSFLLLFPVVIFSAETNSSLNASKNSCITLFTMYISVALCPCK